LNCIGILLFLCLPILPRAEGLLEVVPESDCEVFQSRAPMSNDGHQGWKRFPSWKWDTDFQALEVLIQEAVHDYKNVLRVLPMLIIFTLNYGWMLVIHFVELLSTSFPKKN